MNMQIDTNFSTTNNLTNAVQLKLSHQIKGIISCTVRNNGNDDIFTVIIDTDAFDWTGEYNKKDWTFDDPNDFEEGETPYLIDDFVHNIYLEYQHDILNKFFRV